MKQPLVTRPVGKKHYTVHPSQHDGNSNSEFLLYCQELLWQLICFLCSVAQIELDQESTDSVLSVCSAHRAWKVTREFGLCCPTADRDQSNVQCQCWQRRVLGWRSCPQGRRTGLAAVSLQCLLPAQWHWCSEILQNPTLIQLLYFWG